MLLKLRRQTVCIYKRDQWFSEKSLPYNVYRRSLNGTHSYHVNAEIVTCTSHTLVVIIWFFSSCSERHNIHF